MRTITARQHSPRVARAARNRLQADRCCPYDKFRNLAKPVSDWEPGMLSMEQSVKAQFEKLFDVTDWWLFKTMAELNLKQAAELKKKDMPVPEPYQLVARNSGKRLLIGVGVELLLKSVCLKHGYLINKPKIPGALASPYFDDLRMRNRTRSRSNIFLITHNPHPVRSPSRKATRWDRKRLLNRFESGTKRRAGRQISAERLRCSSNMSFVRNQEHIY